jgi:3,4-dihydroxy 2-butanone 4-phosphate synthase/GTP cyclohydrolase II
MSDIHASLSPVEELIEEARHGRMVVLVDDEDRENEGDVMIPAQFATPEAVNFMARHARGLICLALTRARIDELGLPPMAAQNEAPLQTAFTVSIEAREGVTTGISAPDRARTIAVAIDPACGRGDIVTPGHVFPLAAREGGTLVRTGHTEAAVDIARLAGLNPSGVICEVMSEDGTMARLPELIGFARTHGLKIGSIAELIAYRRRTERLVHRTAEREVSLPVGGTWKLIVYADAVQPAEHVALVKGDLAAPGPVAVRMHAVDLVGDIIDGAGSRALHAAMAQIARDGRGVVVLLREARPDWISSRVLALGAAPAAGRGQLRDYGIGAQILLDLGVRDLDLLSNTQRTIVGIEGYGLNVVGRRAIEGV